MQASLRGPVAEQPVLRPVVRAVVLKKLEYSRGVREDDVGIERGSAQRRDVIRLQHVVVVDESAPVVAHGEFRDAGDGVVEPRRERGAGVWALRVEIDQLETHRRAPLASKHRERGLHQQPVPVNLPLEEVGLAEGSIARDVARGVIARGSPAHRF